MRFAYIDSQGKEVGIPSVEALALRIELGAITSSTELFDAAADRWAPAGEHEIFRTLSREIQEKGEGFVAPLPPSRAETPPAPPQEREAQEEPQEPEVPASASRSGLPEDEEGAFDLGIDLTLADDSEEAAAAEEAPAEEASAPEAPPAAPDVPGFEPLSVEGSSLAEEEHDASLFSSESLELEDSFAASYADEPAQEPPEKPAASGHRGPSSLWDDEGAEGFDEGDEESAPPGWAMEDREELAGTEEEEDSAEADAIASLDESAAWAKSADAPAVRPEGRHPAGGDRGPRSRPASRPSGRPPRSGLPPGVVWGLVLLVVAGGGWFGWSFLQQRRSAATDAAAEPPPVPIPAIPTELEQPYRELSGRALQATVDSLRVRASRRNLPAEPPARWLAGEYMARAGKFPGVATYFQALRGWLDDVQAADSTLYSRVFASLADSAGVTGDQADLLLRRAQAGFSATGRQRRVAYASFAGLLDAAMSLHDFLLQNQDQIEYAPAAGGMSKDPVLEAVPANPAVGNEMWSRVDSITSALDRLGALDKVTTDRLLDVLLNRLQGAGVR